LADPVGHTRAPRYVRGHQGVAVALPGVHPLPDAVVRGADPQRVREPVGAVAGRGEHRDRAQRETRYLVLPRRPDDTADLSVDRSAALVTRAGMIGTAAV